MTKDVNYKILFTQFSLYSPFSLYWELRTILYLGVLLLSSGVGILVYQNIDTIGHQAILALIALAFGVCFYYTHKHKLPYQNQQVTHASPFFDYVVLLGCLLCNIFMGYLQYQYNVFGNHYGFLVFIPTVICFYIAYRFDHKGVLSIAITGLAAVFGLSVTPSQLIQKNDFNNTSIIFTALVFGSTLGVIGLYSFSQNIKKHFYFTYTNFALNILCVATLAALFTQDNKILSLLLLAGLCTYFIRDALKEKSYLFLLLSVLYAYIGFTFYVFYLLSKADDSGSAIISLGIFYVMLSALGVVLFLVNIKKIINKKHEGI